MANEEMRRYWNESAGQEWVGLEDEFERALAPVGTEMLRRAGAKPGQRVLDVGCGLGGTTLAVARAVGAEGRVMGLDISAPMLVRARQRAVDAGLANIDWRDGDAQDAVLPVRYFDLIVSRFGVMFFDDPAAAFENLCSAAKSGGRLYFRLLAVHGDQRLVHIGRPDPDAVSRGAFSVRRAGAVRPGRPRTGAASARSARGSWTSRSTTSA